MLFSLSWYLGPGAGRRWSADPCRRGHLRTGCPQPPFSIFTLAGLLLCGLGILLMAVQWLRELIRALRSHNYRQVLLLLLGAALILLPTLLRH